MTTPYQPRSKKKRRQIRTEADVDEKAARIGKGNISLGFAIAVRAYPELTSTHEIDDWKWDGWRNAPESEKE